jgi:hypothetical protein
MRVFGPQLLEAMQSTKMRFVAPAPGEAEAVDVVPEELRDWLVRLRLLESVPFAYLVADSRLLPEESIRWFHVDRRWTDALVQGALSVGTIDTSDRLQLEARHDEFRAALDRAERNVRRRDDAPRLAGEAGPISGFVLRSRAVAGWPAMQVRAFAQEPVEGDGYAYPDDHPRRMRLLRLERLAPAVLLCLFDGVPREVHVEEPRQGVQFGFDVSRTGTTVRATLRLRDRETARDATPQRDIPVRFRSTGAPGVVDIQRLERDLAAAGEVGPDGALDSAEYALQLIRFPYRQVYGQPGARPVTDAVLTPTVRYTVLADTLFDRRREPR